MQFSAKSFIVCLVSAMTFAFGAVPAAAATPEQDFSASATAVVAPASAVQSLDTVTSGALPAASLDSMMHSSELASTPHGFDVDAAIALAESEVGTSRATGWSQPGECIMSAQRWIREGGGNWLSGGNPVSNYDTATRLTIADAQPGDIVQYEHLESPTSWVSGVHTLLITGVNDDGTFSIIESNIPMGSGLVTKDESWTPQPPEGFQAVVWRF